MCGVGGFTGLGYLSAELRYDLVEALGCGLDARGGHAAGAVAVPEEGQPRLMRKLGTWGTARGRFVRAAAQGHSVMMHTRYATTGKRDEVENAHPFAVKRKTLEGEERTVLYGCHNGMIHGAWETAKKAGREFTVDSKEFFELLADEAYETIRALSGYGVVTFLRPEDRAIRVLRLTRNSDFHAVRIVGGGTVWGSTEKIVKEALEYVSLQEDAVLAISDGKSPTIGRVYRLSGTEAVETKLDNVMLSATATDKRTSGGHTDYSGMYGWGDNDGGGSPYHTNRVYSSSSYGKNWEDGCYYCGNQHFHNTDCIFKHSVVRNETIAENWEKYRDLQDKRNAEVRAKREKDRKATTERITSRNVVLCDDDTYRPVDSHGKVLEYAFPIYVKDSKDGEYRMASSLAHAESIAGKMVSFYAKAKEYPGLGQRRLTEAEIPAPVSTQPSLPLVSQVSAPTGHNGNWAMPPGLSEDEKKEWEDLHRQSPRLAEKLAEDIALLRQKTEEADLEDAASELEEAFAERMMKGD